MRYPANKTKIVCTIGPATETQEMMEALLRAGMNVARLNNLNNIHVIYVLDLHQGEMLIFKGY